MPNRTVAIGAILFGVIAAGQAARAWYGLDLTVGAYHVPVIMSWVAAGVTGLLAILLFRAANA